MFKLRQKDKLSVRTKGIGNALVQVFVPIKFEVRVLDGNWTPYFGKYQNQRWGDWDSDSCWCLSSINSAEDQMEWLWKNGMFDNDARAFFINNGYIDGDGDFSFSERFHEILCGNRDTGGTAQEAWQSFKDRGFIPRSMLDYTLQQAKKFTNQEDFNNDYFNPAMVTQAMKDLGQKSLNYITIAYQRIGNAWQTPNTQLMQKALQQAPLNFGIPVPRIVSNWNNSLVQYDGKISMDHEVEGYYLPADGIYRIFDQYLPNLKTLSKNYFIASAVQGVINAKNPIAINPVPQPQGEENDTFWTWVFAWFNGIFKSPVPVGSTK